MQLSSLMLIAVLSSYILYVSALAIRIRKVRHWYWEAIELTLCFLFSAIAWFLVVKRSIERYCDRRVATMVSSVAAGIVYIAFAGLLGLGVDRLSHARSFYFFLFAFWFSVPTALLVSLIRSTLLQSSKENARDSGPQEKWVKP